MQETGPIPECPRIAVSKLPDGMLPQKFFDALEQNQKIDSCCRHPENHDIEAFKSNADETVPDIYVFHCTCGRKHRRFMVGAGDVRPWWEVR
jgi:hypothetical protein